MFRQHPKLQTKGFFIKTKCGKQVIKNRSSSVGKTRDDVLLTYG